MRRLTAGHRPLVVLSCLSLVSLVIGAGADAAVADTGPSVAPFTACPAIGAVGGCGVVVTLNANGTTTVSQNPNSDGVYDGSDDTLIGVVNNSGHPLSALPLVSTTSAFGFESDGPCTVTPPPSGCTTSSPSAVPPPAPSPGIPTENPLDATGYSGPGVTYSNISADTTGGTVNFAPAIPNGGTAWFGLEDTLTSTTLSVPSAVAISADAATAVPSANDGFTVNVTNATGAAFTVSSIVDTLPAGFSYVSGSTSGAITADPTISGSTLTWTGPFTVPVTGLQFHFGVKVSALPGTFTDTVTGNSATTLNPATATAVINVAIIVPSPAFPVAGLPIAVGLGGGFLLLVLRRRRRRLVQAHSSNWG